MTTWSNQDELIKVIANALLGLFEDVSTGIVPDISMEIVRC